MSIQVRTYYPQESVPDDQVLLECDDAAEAEAFKDWFREEGRTLFVQYKESLKFDEPWEDDWP